MKFKEPEIVMKEMGKLEPVEGGGGRGWETVMRFNIVDEKIGGLS